MDFELWLDESGDFKNEGAKKTRGLKASLVGGVLIKSDVAKDLPFSSLLDADRFHATLEEFDHKDKQGFYICFLTKNKTNIVSELLGLVKKPMTQ